MNFNLKLRIISIITSSYFIINLIYARDFSSDLIKEYQEIVNHQTNANRSKSMAYANIDILVLLMPGAINFDLKTMRNITGDPSLFINDSFYQNWKQNLLGKKYNKAREKEITKLEKLESTKLLSKYESHNQWIKLVQETERIIQEIRKIHGYKLVLLQNTVIKPYSFHNLNRYSILSSNVPNITPIIARYILQKRGMSPDYINKIIKSIKHNFIN